MVFRAILIVSSLRLQSQARLFLHSFFLSTLEVVVFLLGFQVTPKGPARSAKSPSLRSSYVRFSMNPLISGLIGGGASLLGSIFSSDTSAQNTQAQIAASKDEQATQNQFTEQMSNTAYQRATADMKAAGLNPMMMFGSGGPASTPSGSSIQAPMPQTTSKLAGIGDAVNRGLSNAVTAKSMDKMTDEIANLKVQNDLLGAQIDQSRAHASLETGELKNIDERTRTQQFVTAQERNRAITADNEAAISPSIRRPGDQVAYGARKLKDVVEPIAQGVSTATGAGRALADSAFRRRFYFGE